MRTQSSGHTTSKPADQFILAAGVRALYDSNRGQPPQVVRVQLVEERHQRATVRDGEGGPGFTVPIHALLPPLRVYGKRGRTFTAMHHPFKWSVVDTLENYANSGLLSKDGDRLLKDAEVFGDPEANTAIETLLAHVPTSEDI